MQSSHVLLRVAVASVLCLVVAPFGNLPSVLVRAAEPVVISVETPHPLHCGVWAELYFTIDAKGQEISSVRFPMKLTYSSGNTVGSITENSHFTWTIEASDAFETLVFDPPQGSAATNPDTVLWHASDADGVGWNDSALFCMLKFKPADSGTIQLDTCTIDGVSMQVLDSSGSPLPFVWQEVTRFVTGEPNDPCPCLVPGDFNQDGEVNAQDIIGIICFVFRDCCWGVCPTQCADANCNGSLTSADVVYLVSYMFKGGPAPCDYCATMWRPCI